jgi:hypothetical protein
MTIENNIIKSRPNITQSTLQTYLVSLKKIKEKIAGNSTLNNTKFLHEYDKIIDLLNQSKITTQKNKITAIIVALSSDKKLDKELIKNYQTKLTALNKEYMEFLTKQEKTDTQSRNWIDYDDLIGVYNELLRDVKKDNLFSKKELTDKEFILVQELILLKTHIDYPLRNDFADMKIITAEDCKNLKEDDNNNYLCIDNDNMKFILNDFKNRKRLGKKEIEVNKNLNKLIKKWIKINKSGYFLVKKNRKTPLTSNQITKTFNRLFLRKTGKLISTSMIRHIIISHLTKNEPTILEAQENDKKIENKFLHSSQVNKLYRKID